MKYNLKSFFVGALAATMVTTTIVPAAASSLKNINVATGGIKVYVDGNLKVLKDAKGKTIEPMIYDGTTYLPLRACVGLVSNKEVAWDGKTESIYIGKKPSAGQQVIPIHELKVYKHWEPETGKNAYYKLFKEKYTCFNLFNGNPATYKLDSKYSELHGYLVVTDDAISEKTGKPVNVNVDLEIYSVDKYGEETLIDRYEAKYGDDPIEISTNISGCNFIKIKNGGKTAFYDVTLKTAK